MSQRFRRVLLGLYPSRFRRRYGRELLDLQDELSREGELSSARLTGDAIAGALIARSARQRALLLGSGLLIAALVLAGATVAGKDRPAHVVGHAQLAAVAVTPTRPTVPYGRSCFVSSGTCSPRACSEYTTSQSSATVPPHAVAVHKQQPRRTTAMCVNDPRASKPQARTVFVTGAELIQSSTPTEAQPTASSASATLATSGS